jgi:hypothetical protein
VGQTGSEPHDVDDNTSSQFFESLLSTHMYIHILQLSNNHISLLSQP